LRALLVGVPLVLGSLGSLGSLGCTSPEVARTRGSVGVFYGGQLQELSVVDWKPERLPTLGFRLTFAGPGPHRVNYEVTRPGPAGRRVAELGALTPPAGQLVLDQRISLEPTSPKGTWNVRVSVDDRVVIDRALVIAGLRPDEP
jgi:hypothetical protein